MSRPRTGSTYLKGKIRQIRITTDRDGAHKPRWSKPCPPNPDGTPMSEIDAKKVASDLQKAYDTGKWDPWVKPVVVTSAPKPTEELTKDYATRWFAARVAKGLRSVQSERARFSVHVRPDIGDIPIAKVTRSQIEDLVASLDTKVTTGVIRPKTAQNVWAMVTKMFRDAKDAKSRHLRVRHDNPCADVAGPDRGNTRSGPYLYPSEFTTLVGCKLVELAFRRIITLAAYSYTRAGEIEALEWSDVDFEHDTIHVHGSADSRTGVVRETKTAASNRRIPIEPALRPLLVAMHAEAGGQGRVIPEMPDRRYEAPLLREAMRVAGLTRAALFANDPTRRPLSFHDLRATGTTWCAVRGDEALRIMQRAGHTEFKTTQGYIREAENLRSSFGTVFPALPAELLGLATCLATTSPKATPPAAESMRQSERDGKGTESVIRAPGGPRWLVVVANEDTDDPPGSPGDRLATGLATDGANDTGPYPLRLNLIYPRFYRCTDCRGSRGKEMAHGTT